MATGLARLGPLLPPGGKPVGGRQPFRMAELRGGLVLRRLGPHLMAAGIGFFGFLFESFEPELFLLLLDPAPLSFPPVELVNPGILELLFLRVHAAAAADQLGFGWSRRLDKRGRQWSASRGMNCVRQRDCGAGAANIRNP